MLVVFWWSPDVPVSFGVGLTRPRLGEPFMLNHKVSALSLLASRK